MKNIVQDKSVNLALICDENYVMPTVVAMTSMKATKDAYSTYSVYVFTSDVSKESREKIISMNDEQAGFFVRIVETEELDVLKKCAINGLHVSTAALVKFFIADLLDGLDKVLYLDGDILVQKDLTRLYNTELGNKYAAVVKDYKPMVYNPPQTQKLGIAHKSYFNSGVMLLNLKKFRADRLNEKLVNYRLHGLNFFMDQDALNVVFSDNVLHLDLLDNAMSSTIFYFDFEELSKYYGIEGLNSKKEIYENATIVHLCTKYKPWKYSNVPYAREWYAAYKLSPFCKEWLPRETLGFDIYRKVFANYGVGNHNYCGVEIPEITISMTSYPARIDTVYKTIESLLIQTVPVDRVVLWLAAEQFPNGMDDLPQELQDYASRELTIKWCEDLKPHKKYFFALQEYPDDVIITVDDDVYYPENLIETLVRSYIKFPYAVSATRAHLIQMDGDKVAPYSKWKREFNIEGYPSISLCATGVGGVLYPPHIFSNEVFNVEAIKMNCLMADDLWLKLNELLTDTPVVVAGNCKNLRYVEDTQECALYHQNDIGCGNDEVLSKLLEKYNSYYGKNTLLQKLCISNANSEPMSIETQKLRQQLKRARHEKKEIEASIDYRIGRLITWFPRKIRGGIQCLADNGWKYTVEHFFQKVLRKLGVK